MKNKYIIRSGISEAKFRQVLRLFCLDIEASKVAQITHLSRPLVNRLFDKIRPHISGECERCSPFAEGEIELDESYFGARRAGRGAVMYSDGFKTYDGLADFGYKQHYRIKHSDNHLHMGIITSMASRTSGALQGAPSTLPWHPQTQVLPAVERVRI